MILHQTVYWSISGRANDLAGLPQIQRVKQIKSFTTEAQRHRGTEILAACRYTPPAKDANFNFKEFINILPCEFNTLFYLRVICVFCG